MQPEREKRVQTICLLVISAVAVAFALYWLQPVLVPFVLALFLAIGLKPLVDLQVRRLRFPRNLAVVSTLLISLVVLAGVGLLVTLSVQSLIANAGVYRDRVQQLIVWAARHLPENVVADPEALRQELQDAAGPMFQKIVVGATNVITELVSSGTLVVIFLCFLLFGSGGGAASGAATWREIESRTRHYILTKTAISTVTGICVGLVLWLLGVQPALVFGLLAMLLNFIPNVGSFIATLLPLPMVLLDPGFSLVTVVLVIALPITIQTLVGNVIEPRVLGRSLRLHPITLLMALIFWGALWGIVGMFLAAPLTAVLRILLAKSELTASAADLLGGHIGRQRGQEE